MRIPTWSSSDRHIFERREGGEAACETESAVGVGGLVFVIVTTAAAADPLPSGDDNDSRPLGCQHTRAENRSCTCSGSGSSHFALVFVRASEFGLLSGVPAPARGPFPGPLQVRSRCCSTRTCCDNSLVSR